MADHKTSLYSKDEKEVTELIVTEEKKKKCSTKKISLTLARPGLEQRFFCALKISDQPMHQNANCIFSFCLLAYNWQC